MRGSIPSNISPELTQRNLILNAERNEKEGRGNVHRYSSVFGATFYITVSFRSVENYRYFERLYIQLLLPFSFPNCIPESRPGYVALPHGGLFVITVELEHHVVGRLEWTWKKDENKKLNKNSSG